MTLPLNIILGSLKPYSTKKQLPENTFPKPSLPRGRTFLSNHLLFPITSLLSGICCSCVTAVFRGPLKAGIHWDRHDTKTKQEGGPGTLQFKERQKMEVETEAQQGEVTCQRSHSRAVAETISTPILYVLVQCPIHCTPLPQKE